MKDRAHGRTRIPGSSQIDNDVANRLRAPNEKIAVGGLFEWLRAVDDHPETKLLSQGIVIHIDKTLAPKEAIEVKGEDLPQLILVWRQAHPMRVIKAFVRHVAPDEVVYMELVRMTITAA
jgi:hypothetical protein